MNEPKKDGDIFKCRFRQDQREKWYPESLWPSLSVDPDTCRVTYTGSRDKTEIQDLKSAYKLIDLILEDFDSDGNVRIGLMRFDYGIQFQMMWIFCYNS